MKVLLIDPKRINLETYLIIPNVGIGYLATALRRAGHEPAICHAARDSILPAAAARLAGSGNFDVVGITAFTPYLSSAAAYAREVRKAAPRAVIVVGGPHAIFEPEETFERIPEADYVVTGEGEETFPALLSLIEDGRAPGGALSELPNLCFRDNGGYALTPRKLIDDIRPLDMPAWDLIEPHRFGLYPNGIFTMKKKVAPVISSRGCPYPCAFCGAGRAMGKRIRLREPAAVADEIEMLGEKYGIPEIQFMDDNFLGNRDYAGAVCGELIRRNLGMIWGCPPGVRVNCIDDEIVKLMRRAGCYSTSLGIESGSQRVLGLMKKQIDIKDVPERIGILRKHGIRITGLFVLGFPGETVEEMRQTVDFALKLDINRVNFFTFTPFPGSDMYDRLKAEGKLKNLDYDETYIHNLSFCDESIPELELIRAQRSAHIRFYLRPKILLGILGEIHSLTQVKIIVQRAMKIVFPKKIKRG